MEHIETNKLRHHHLIFLSSCIASGVFWGVIAATYFDVKWPLVLFTVPIAIAVGYVSRGCYRQQLRSLVPWSLVSLYMAVILLALAGGVYVAVFPSVPIQPPRGPLGNIAEGIVMVLLGFTMKLYFLFLWPLAFLNHWLLRQLVQQNKSADAVEKPNSISGPPYPD